VRPCQNPANDPEDWFIERDGKQYPDDVLVPDSELEKVAFEQRADYVEGREDLLIRDALRRRRHAKDKCFTECSERFECLSLAIDGPTIEYGTFGGYYTEERREIVRARDARAARRERRLLGVD